MDVTEGLESSDSSNIHAIMDEKEWAANYICVKIFVYICASYYIINGFIHFLVFSHNTFGDIARDYSDCQSFL